MSTTRFQCIVVFNEAMTKSTGFETVTFTYRVHDTKEAQELCEHDVNRLGYTGADYEDIIVINLGSV